MLLNTDNPFLNQEGNKPKKDFYQEIQDNVRVHQFKENYVPYIQSLENKQGTLALNQRMENLKARQEGRWPTVNNAPKIKEIQIEIDKTKKEMWDIYSSGR